MSFFVRALGYVSGHGPLAARAGQPLTLPWKPA